MCWGNERHVDPYSCARRRGEVDSSRGTIDAVGVDRNRADYHTYDGSCAGRVRFRRRNQPVIRLGPDEVRRRRRFGDCARDRG